MNYQHILVFYQPITPLHVGCGQDVGIVDLPVIRERTTEYPFIPGSGIRGSVRERFEAAKSPATEVLFGPLAEREGSDDEVRYAGCVAVHDAKILLFPVRSDRTVFLWITCPAVLRRFDRDRDVFTKTIQLPGVQVATSPGDEEVVGPEALKARLYLEEFAFTRSTAAPGGLKAWADEIGKVIGITDLGERTVLVSDRTFHYFVNHATAILQHNRLTSAKTVEEGGLFSVEAVPPEAVFYGFFGATEPRRPAAEGEETWSRGKVLAELKTLGGAMTGSVGYLHLGGDESTGLGVTQIVWAGPDTGGQP